MSREETVQKMWLAWCGTPGLGLKVGMEIAYEIAVRGMVPESELEALRKERDALKAAREQADSLYTACYAELTKTQAENAALKAQIARLSAPVTFAELLPLNEKYGWFQYGDAQGDKSLAFANSLIAARKEDV